ncbi:MAG: hypothetical protein RSB55_03760 [Oscillospiraceae bacterium]
MEYGQYIVKRRMRAKAICEKVNIPWGTILPAADGFIWYHDKHLCAVGSQNAKAYFWGYDPADPETEIERQKAAEQLMDTAPKDSGDALASRGNPWNRYGSLDQVPGGWRWVWNEETVENLPYCQLSHLLDCTRTGKAPVEVPA